MVLISHYTCVTRRICLHLVAARMIYQLLRPKNYGLSGIDASKFCQIFSLIFLPV